nr:ABC-three component system middle component 6 [Vibrio cyclitrophicus]
MQITSSELDVSIDHIILSLDWLFMISAINVNGNTVTINEAQ